MHILILLLLLSFIQKSKIIILKKNRDISYTILII